MDLIGPVAHRRQRAATINHPDTRVIAITSKIDEHLVELVDHETDDLTAQRCVDDSALIQWSSKPFILGRMLWVAWVIGGGRVGEHIEVTVRIGPNRGN